MPEACSPGRPRRRQRAKLRPPRSTRMISAGQLRRSKGKAAYAHSKSNNSEECTHHIAGWAREQCFEKSAPVSFVERSAAVNKASKYPQVTLLRFQNTHQ